VTGPAHWLLGDGKPQALRTSASLYRLFVIFVSFILHGTVGETAVDTGEDDPSALLLGVRGIVMDEQPVGPCCASI
jgi:hypothetical protein